MTKRYTSIQWLLIPFLFAVLGFPVFSLGEESSSQEVDIKGAIDHSLKWLKGQQQDDGSWEGDVGITSLALTAFLRSPRRYREADGPFIRKPVRFLLDSQKADGGIYEMHLPVYNTSVALMALAALENASYEVAIQRAQKFLVETQSDEGEGYTKDDKFYGGIGYGSDLRPDLSNLQMALEAIKESNASEFPEVWERAITFLERCQNRSESNDQEWAGNDGGFIYYPGHSPAGETTSYGSMTYAGLKSYIYAGLSKEDPRVKAAFQWISRNYSLEENPGMGQQGVFYYYHTFSKTMSVLGQKEIVDAGGKTHSWFDELVTKLLSLRKPDGYWVNESSGRWWESNRVLATSYALLALEQGVEFGQALNP